MSQTLQAVREPTMDEILTSIREIIEENYVQDKVASSVNNKTDQTPKDSKPYSNITQAFPKNQNKEGKTNPLSSASLNSEYEAKKSYNPLY